MAATKTTKRTTNKVKSPATKKPAAKSAAPRKRAVARQSVTQANVKTVVSLADDEKRLMLLVIVWLALIGVFLGMVVYQIYLS